MVGTGWVNKLVTQLESPIISAKDRVRPSGVDICDIKITLQLKLKFPHCILYADHLPNEPNYIDYIENYTQFLAKHLVQKIGTRTPLCTNHIFFYLLVIIDLIYMNFTDVKCGLSVGLR